MDNIVFIFKTIDNFVTYFESVTILAYNLKTVVILYILLLEKHFYSLIKLVFVLHIHITFYKHLYLKNKNNHHQMQNFYSKKRTPESNHGVYSIFVTNIAIL